jgi:predicted Rossmann fold nucleotide-binding protein DprA/Smf involved in DNA uptake
MNSLLSIWNLKLADTQLTGRGDAKLLDTALTAFFASRQCPGIAIHTALDWAVQKTKQRQTVIGGFHSPLEQSVLRILLTAKSPAVVVLARNAAKAKLSAEWLDAIQAGQMVVISARHEAASIRLTNVIAHERNELAASLAHTVVVAHASPTGKLAEQVRLWREAGRTIDILV